MDALKIIPQVFFDLIGRAIPGILAMLLATILLEDSWKDQLLTSMAALSDRQTGSISIVLIFLVAYIIGHLVSPLTKGVQRFREKDDIEGFHSKKYEWLRVHQTEAGGHCAKLRAEFSMYNSFTAIFLLFSVMEIVEGFLFDLNHFIIALVLIILAYFMQARGKEGVKTFQENVIRFYEASNDPKDNSE